MAKEAIITIKSDDGIMVSSKAIKRDNLYHPITGALNDWFDQHENLPKDINISIIIVGGDEDEKKQEHD